MSAIQLYFFFKKKLAMSFWLNRFVLSDLMAAVFDEIKKHVC